ncbi:MAG TPA: tRNA epoxyqueuosine(34) reductase QueG [Tepidisphaeraceae bacterium]|jgi:epoxyqueuosine reductase|nr:tRNA epoxyqueuosine(34) reductase QueG [Tepidisphaeraceae bacterium]
MPSVLPQPDRLALALQIKQRATDLGFNLVGIAPAGRSIYRDYFAQWLAGGKAGEMRYLHNRFDERTDVGQLLPGARSVVCVALNYHVPLMSAEPADVNERDEVRIARYALADDYHEIIKPRLYDLADFIREVVPDAQTKCGVDTAPIMEKELAARAGVGWIGKSTNLINPYIGSWLLLGEVITTLELPTDEPAVDRCGTCRRCIDACPTGAITAPYEMDARRCISYLTIEHRGEVADELAGKMDNWLYGCDICQDVCPWNSKAIDSDEPSLQPRFASGTLNASELLSWEPQTYYDTLRGSAMRRVKLPILKRNAEIVQSNIARPSGPSPGTPGEGHSNV